MTLEEKKLKQAQADAALADEECERARESAQSAARRKVKKISSSSVNLSRSALERLVRSELKSAMKNELQREITDDEVLKADVDEILSEEISGKKQNRVDIDVREHVIPSKIIEEELKEEMMAEQAMIIDDDQFDSKQRTKFSQTKITEYIDVMIKMFDIDPYYEIERKRKGKTGEVYTEYEVVANDLPLFGDYGFQVGLTPQDIETLRHRIPRFSHAYDMCKQKQEQILVTNMLLGNYGSQPSIFTAKNLLGWKNEEAIDLTNKLDIDKLLEKIMDDSEEFINDDTKSANAGQGRTGKSEEAA